MHTRDSSRSTTNRSIDKLDFGQHQKSPSTAHGSDYSSTGGLLGDDESLLSNVVDGVIDRDKQRLRRVIIRCASFACATLCCLCAGSIMAFSLYGPLFLSRLRYTQFQVNAVSVTAELAQYLSTPLVGYLCDRYSSRPLSLAAAFLFGGGYLLAAFTYRQGPPQEGGWPVGAMMVAFAGVGMGTCSMTIGSVTACAKNFGKSKHRGLALALPLAAFGLSGMCLSQVGSRLLYETRDDGARGDVDAYRYFLFLGGLLFGVGVIGAVALRVVDEEETFHEAVDERERNGPGAGNPPLRRSLLHDSETDGYGAISCPSPSQSSFLRHPSRSPPRSYPPDFDHREKALLNTETRRFLTDRGMWVLTGGFFLVVGPGETFINNLGTIVNTLYPPTSAIAPSSNSSATNVSVVAISSTVARLLTGVLSDLLAPRSSYQSSPEPRRNVPEISRSVFLLISAVLPSLAQLLLASGLVQHDPALFPLVSALVGLGYGTVFTITPIIITVVWGVHNFGTNWSIVAMTSAGGAAVWSAVYSAVYQRGVAGGKKDEAARLCYGVSCYATTFWSMAICSWVAVGLWIWVWRGWSRKGILV